MRLNVRIVSDHPVLKVGEPVSGTVKTTHPTRGPVAGGKLRLELRVPGNEGPVAAVDGATDDEGAFHYELPRPAVATSLLVLHATVEAEGIDGDARATIVTLFEDGDESKPRTKEVKLQRRRRAAWVAVAVLSAVLVAGVVILLATRSERVGELVGPALEPEPEPQPKPATATAAPPHPTGVPSEDPVKPEEGLTVVYILTRPLQLEVINAANDKSLGISPVITNVSREDMPLRVRVKRGSWLSQSVEVPVRFDRRGSTQFEIDVDALKEEELASRARHRRVKPPKAPQNPPRKRKRRPAIRRVVRRVKRGAGAPKQPIAAGPPRPPKTAKPKSPKSKDRFGTVDKKRSKPAIGTVGEKPAIGTVGRKPAIGTVGRKPAIGALRE